MQRAYIRTRDAGKFLSAVAQDCTSATFTSSRAMAKAYDTQEEAKGIADRLSISVDVIVMADAPLPSELPTTTEAFLGRVNTILGGRF